MKTQGLKILGAAVMVGALVFGVATYWAAVRNPAYQFQEAIDLMETKGDYPAAIRVFEELAKGADRNLAARSLLYAGLCYEKLGKDEAQKAYQRLVREFADQRAEVAEARTRLAALGQPANLGNGSTMVVRRVWTGPKVDVLGSPSPDGRYLSFVDWYTGDLAIRNLASGMDRRLTNKGSWNESTEFALFSRFSPDGARIAYSWFNKDFFFDLRLVGSDGSGTRVVYRNEEVVEPDPKDWSPDGKYILTIFYRKDRTNQIALVSVADGAVRVLKTLDWRSPSGMGFSPDGRYIVYDFPPKEDSPDRDIFLLSTDGSREIPLVEHPGNDLFPVWTPDGKNVLFASDRTGTLSAWVIPVADGKPQGSPELVKQDMGRTFPMGFTRKGSFYYGLEIGKQDVYIASIDPATGKLLSPPTNATPRFLGSNTSPEWSPDGKYLAYFSRRGPVLFGPRTQQVIVRYVTSGEERELSLGLNYTNRLRWSPDGRSFLVAGADLKGRQGIYKIDVGTSSVAPVVQSPTGHYANFPTWSPDGKRIFYLLADSNGKIAQIVAREMTTGQEAELFRTASPPNALRNLALSPDGQQLAFTLDEPATRSSAVKVMPSKGGEARELYRVRDPETMQYDSIAWTPDGRQVIFGTARSTTEVTKTQLWRIPVTGGETQKVELAMDGVLNLRFHPDGHRVAFTAGLNLSEVWVMENFLPALRAAR